MKIGLIDADGHTKIKKWGSAFPNLALMKISAWHKKKGDIVEWARSVEECGLGGGGKNTIFCMQVRYLFKVVILTFISFDIKYLNKVVQVIR